MRPYSPNRTDTPPSRNRSFLLELRARVLAIVRSLLRRVASGLMPTRARAHVANAGPLPAIPDLAPAVERGHATVADAYQVRDEPTLAGAVKRIRQGETREQAIAEATNTPPLHPPPSCR